MGTWEKVWAFHRSFFLYSFSCVKALPTCLHSRDKHKCGCHLRLQKWSQTAVPHLRVLWACASHCLHLPGRRCHPPLLKVPRCRANFPRDACDLPLLLRAPRPNDNLCPHFPRGMWSEAKLQGRTGDHEWTTVLALLGACVNYAPDTISGFQAHLRLISARTWASLPKHEPLKLTCGPHEGAFFSVLGDANCQLIWSQSCFPLFNNLYLLWDTELKFKTTESNDLSKCQQS